jgi:uncharacterized membrane protein YfcA
MILVFPLLLVAATFLVLRRAGDRRPSPAGTRWRWFAAWSVAGAAIAFSFVTGLSIGIFVLPFAAVVLLWVARNAPRRSDALGFVEGIGAVLLLVALLNRSDTGVDPMPWLLAGLSLAGSAALAYGLLGCRTRRAGTESRRIRPG